MSKELKDYEKELSSKLKEVFGKDTFTEDELTKEFFVELCTQCPDFFTDDNGAFDYDLFWSDEIKNFLVKKK